MQNFNANFQGDTPMKTNRSKQRTNLTAGTWMPLTPAFLALALIAPNHLYAAPEADKDLAQQIFDTMLQLPGNKPGNRLVHAKGIVCQGTFAPSKDAASLSKAAHFQGGSIPVTIRFSDGAPAPSIPDNSEDAGPR